MELDDLWRMTTMAGVGFGVWFGLALKRHNRKNAFLEDLNRWTPIATSVLLTYVRRALQSGRFVLDDAVVRCPPRVPHMSLPYYAISWFDFDDDLHDSVHTQPCHADDPISALREFLPYLGLGHLAVNDHLLTSQVYFLIPNADGTTKVVLASTINDPADYQRYPIAVLLHEHGIVWVHRIDKKRASKK